MQSHIQDKMFTTLLRNPHPLLSLFLVQRDYKFVFS